MVKIIPADNKPVVIMEGTRPARDTKLVSNSVVSPCALGGTSATEKKTRISKLDRKKMAGDEAKQRLYAFIETEPKKKDVREYFIKRLEELSKN